MSLHKMVNNLFSMCMIHSRKLHFTFLLYFFKAYLPFLQGTEANKQNATCNLHRLPKIPFQFYIEEETSPQSFFSYLDVRLEHVQIVVCQPPKQQKSVWIIQISGKMARPLVRCFVLHGGERWRKSNGCCRVPVLPCSSLDEPVHPGPYTRTRTSVSVAFKHELYTFWTKRSYRGEIPSK